MRENAESHATVIASFRAIPLSEIMNPFGFAIAGLIAVVGMAYQLAFRSPYAMSHLQRYVTLWPFVLGATVYAGWRAIELLSLRIRAARDRRAIYVDGDEVVFIRPIPRRVVLHHVSAVSLDPDDRVWGRPERLVLSVVSGATIRVRSDVLEPHGPELLEAVTELFARSDRA